MWLLMMTMSVLVLCPLSTYSILCPPKSPQVASAELVTQLLSGMGVHPIDCEVSLV